MYTRRFMDAAAGQKNNFYEHFQSFNACAHDSRSRHSGTGEILD
jgi:hypothetical protein